jgi:hypothetical protein
MLKLNQKVECRIEVRHTDARVASVISDVLSGTNHCNLRSKIHAWVDRQLVAWNFEHGAMVTVNIGAADRDEFSRPLPE